MLLSQGAFARECGVSPSAISKAIKAGRILRGLDGLDTENPLNAAYLSDTRYMVEGELATGRRKPKGDAVSPLDPYAKYATGDSPRPEEHPEASFLVILADLGSGFEPVVRYSFDETDHERDIMIYAGSRLVKVNLDGPEPVVYDARSLEPFPTTREVGGRGDELARQFRA